MKRNGIIVLLFLFIIILTAKAASSGSVVNTKHNLSTSGTGSMKSDVLPLGGTSQICIFCHTPHSGASDAPLWNKTYSTSIYKPYTSDIMSWLVGTYSYPAIESPSGGSGVAQHVKTRICLSCHDGTIALGQLRNLPFEGGGSKLTSDIAMKNTILGMMPSTSTGFIGVDLRDDHPVSVPYDPTKDPELLTINGGSKIWLYGYDNVLKIVTRTHASGADKYVECTSCHNAHDNQYGNFLVDTNQYSAICTACHTKQIGSATPAHDNASSFSYNPPNGTGALGSTVANIKCMNCHFPHKAGVDSGAPTTPSPATGQYLLSYKEDQTCFNKTNRYGDTVNVCHGLNQTGGALDIEAEVGKKSITTSAHQDIAGSYQGKHGDIEALKNSSYGWLTSTGWHVTCADCHNAHTAGKTKHTAPTNLIANNSPLYGAGGVRVAIWPAAWGGGTSNLNFAAFEPLGAMNSTGGTMPSPYMEYQICIKCHSSSAWGGILANQPNITDLNGLTSVKMTDQVQEFSNNIASWHPVAFATGRNQGTLLPPWMAGRGVQTMYCSDCHGNNAASPVGPHGSTNPGLLVSNFTDTYSTTLSQIQPASDLCLTTCHDPNVYSTGSASVTGTGFSNTGSVLNLHTQHRIKSNVTGTGAYAYRCVNCHTRVSHGYKNKAMIVLKNDGVPYEAGGTNTGKITFINLPASGSYNTLRTTPDCTTVVGCHT